MRSRLCSYLLLATLVSAALAAHAQSSSASFQVPRQSIDAGAGRTSSPTYTLHGTLGQPEAAGAATSASYVLRGGFHVATPVDSIFRNGFEP